MDEIDIYLEEDLGSEGDITSDALFTDERARAVSYTHLTLPTN